MKKYKLKKDLPYAKAGDVFEVNRIGNVSVPDDNGFSVYTPKELPDFFEEVDGRWKPEVDEEYWFLTPSGDVDVYLWRNDKIDHGFYKFGNCFKTEKQAKAAAKGVKEYLLNRDE